MVYNIVSIIGLILAIIFFLWSKALKKGALKAYKIDYKETYIVDEQIEQIELKDSNNAVYSVKDELKEIIDRYIISSYLNNKVLVFKYVKEVIDLTLKISVFDKNFNHIDTYLLKETTTNNHSKKIELSNEATYINVSIVEDNNMDILNNFKYKNKEHKKYQITILQTYTLFSILIPISYLIMVLIDKNFTSNFLTLENTLFTVVFIFIFAFINYKFSKKSYNSRKSKVRVHND